MNKSQLQKKFLEYLQNGVKEANLNQGGLIFSKEYFHINIPNNTIYVQGFGLIARTEPFSKEFLIPDWIAYYQEDITITGYEDNKFILGYGNPYGAENSHLFPNKLGPIGFIPYSYYLKNKKS